MAKEKDKKIEKTDFKMHVEKRNAEFKAATKAVRAAVLQAYEDHNLLPAEVLAILAGAMSEFMGAELERQYEEADAIE